MVTRRRFVQLAAGVTGTLMAEAIAGQYARAARRGYDGAAPKLKPGVQIIVTEDGLELDDFPPYLINVLAPANALAGVVIVHNSHEWIPPDDPGDGSVTYLAPEHGSYDIHVDSIWGPFSKTVEL